MVESLRRLSKSSLEGFDLERFNRMFPVELDTRALTPIQAAEQGLPLDRTHYLYLSRFVCNSRFGRLTALPGETTDFGSVPKYARSFIDNDEPVILWGACGHDLGWRHKRTDEGHILTLKEVNIIILDGMEICGASWFRRHVVYQSVTAYGKYKGWPHRQPDIDFTSIPRTSTSLAEETRKAPKL